MKRLSAVVLILGFFLGAFASLAEAISTPELRISPSKGPPTRKITINGTGFGIGEAVDVYFDATDMLVIATDGEGKFSCKLKVPSSAEPGQHWTTCVGRRSGSAAFSHFTVQTNWSQFRFNHRHSGYNPYENVLSRLTVPGLNEAWIADTHAYITVPDSSPSVVDGVVYVGSQGQFDSSLHAFDARTGAAMPGWPVSTGPIGTGYSIHSSPAVANGVIYVLDGDGGLWAFDTAGRALWRASAGRPLNGCRAEPVVSDGMVYAQTCDGYLRAYGLETELSNLQRKNAGPPDPASLVPDHTLKIQR